MRSDYLKHLVAGYLIALLCGALFGPFIGLTAAVLAGAAKELIWDILLKRGAPEWLDFILTAAGGLAAILPALIM